MQAVVLGAYRKALPSASLATTVASFPDHFRDCLPLPDRYGPLIYLPYLARAHLARTLRVLCVIKIAFGTKTTHDHLSTDTSFL